MQNTNTIVTVATAMNVPLNRFKIKLQFSQKTWATIGPNVCDAPPRLDGAYEAVPISDHCRSNG